LPETGLVTVAYEKTKGILFHSNARSKSKEAEIAGYIEATEPELDVIGLTNGDKLKGAVTNVNSTGLAADVNGREMEIPIAELSYVVFTQEMLVPEDRFRSPTDWHCVIRTTFGNRLYTRMATLNNEKLSGKMLNGDDIEVLTTRIATIEFLNGAAVKLTLLSPTSFEHKPWFVRTWPHKIDKAVSGAALKMKGRFYENGIGTHAYTRLEYDIAETYSRFRSVIGIDDSSGGMGSVVFRVLGDKKVLYESRVMKPGTIETVDVAVDGVKVLELETDFGGDDDLGDHANWCDPRLVRKLD
jgi:hypothetical protein